MVVVSLTHGQRGKREKGRRQGLIIPPIACTLDMTVPLPENDTDPITVPLTQLPLWVKLEKSILSPKASYPFQHQQ